MAECSARSGTLGMERRARRAKNDRRTRKIGQHADIPIHLIPPLVRAGSAYHLIHSFLIGSSAVSPFLPPLAIVTVHLFPLPG